MGQLEIENQLDKHKADNLLLNLAFSLSQLQKACEEYCTPGHKMGRGYTAFINYLTDEDEILSSIATVSTEGRYNDA
jgi:hypothetical protein